MTQEDARQYLQEYSIKLGPGDDPSTEQRGVMVIKSKSKTRAKQRKGALANWKVSPILFLKMWGWGMVRISKLKYMRRAAEFEYVPMK